MKKVSTRTVSLNFRATKEEAERIKSNAKEAKMPQSEYLRKCCLNQNIQPVINGKEISESIGLLHGKMQNYRQDVVNRFEKIRECVDNLKEIAAMNHSPSAEILALELSGINANLSVIMSNYEREEQEVEKNAMALVAPIKGKDA